MSKLSEILDAIVTDHTAAALTVGGRALTAVKRKLPKKGEAGDANYQVTVSGAELADKVKRIAFGQRYSVVYRIEMTLVTPNDQDQLTNLDDVTDWREATRARYMRSRPISVAGVQRVDVEDGKLFDRSLLHDGYDYCQVVIAVETYENRST